MGLGCVPCLWTCKSAYWIQTLATILKSVVFLTPIQCQHSHPYLQFVSTNDTFYQPVSATWTPSPVFENRSNSWRVSIAVRISSILMHPGGLLTRKISCNTLKEIMLCMWCDFNETILLEHSTAFTHIVSFNARHMHVDDQCYVALSANLCQPTWLVLSKVLYYCQTLLQLLLFDISRTFLQWLKFKQSLKSALSL